MSMILDALRKARQRGEGKRGPAEAQNLMNSFGFSARANRNRTRRIWLLLIPAVLLVLVSSWLYLRRPSAPRNAVADSIAVPPAASPAEPAVEKSPAEVSAATTPESPATVSPEVRKVESGNPSGPAARTNLAATPVSVVSVSPQASKPPAPVAPPRPASLQSVAAAVLPVAAAPPPVQRQSPGAAAATASADASSRDSRDPYDALLAFYAVGDYPRALEECRRALQLRPDGESTHLNCAAVYIQLGNLPDAARELGIVTRLNDKNDKAFNNLGSVHMLQGDNAAADAAFEKAILINPSNASAHLNRGVIARQAGRTDRAMADFLAVVQLEDRNARAHQNLAELFEAQGETAKALTHYRRFRELALGLLEYRADVARAEAKISELDTRLPRP